MCWEQAKYQQRFAGGSDGQRLGGGGGVGADGMPLPGVVGPPGSFALGGDDLSDSSDDDWNQPEDGGGNPVSAEAYLKARAAAAAEEDPDVAPELVHPDPVAPASVAAAE